MLKFVTGLTFIDLPYHWFTDPQVYRFNELLLWTTNLDLFQFFWHRLVDNNVIVSEMDFVNKFLMIYLNS